MIVTIRLFAILRERAGAGSVEIELEEGATVADALARVEDLTDGLPVVMAVNRDYASDDRRLSPGDELALVPPVSGGDPAGDSDVHVAIRSEPLDPAALSRSVVRDAAGALVTFQGTTREVERLDYEAYAEMAEPKLAAIASEVCERHGLEAIAIEHRVGPVALGEPSVIVAVAAGHREEAFAGAREAIDRVKAEAPIWKREVEGSSARWVEGEVPRR